MGKLPLSYYRGADVLEIAQSLLGKSLYSKIDNKLTGGTIIETEAYAGAKDKACHAYGNKFTNRTKTMFEAGGVAYIYLCYGIHHLFNVITNQEGIPDAVLIRAIMPHTGIETMLHRRSLENIERRITSGPGSMSQAMGIHVSMDATPLNSNKIWIADEGFNVPASAIKTTPRIGINYAGEYKDKPWRFLISE